jgi:serine O-acetyltransferase
MTSRDPVGNEPPFAEIAARLARPFAHLMGKDHADYLAAFPDRTNAGFICDLLLNQLFPGFFADCETLARSGRAIGLPGLFAELETHIRRSLRYVAIVTKSPLEEVHEQANALTLAAINDLPGVLDLLISDVEAAFANDPAALDRETIILSYPCIEALAIQRFAHCLYLRHIPLLPRMLTEVAHSRTGIDIHPGAHIGASFFVDHGTGVVIGETCTIGTHCVLYQGVTLGAWNPTATDGDGQLQRGHGNKRHPDLQDHVTVYAGATILGGSTCIGHHSVIGGKVWLTSSVEPHSVVMIEEPKLTIRKRKNAN